MDLNISTLARHRQNIANFLTIHKLFHISQSARPALYTAAFAVLRVYHTFWVLCMVHIGGQCALAGCSAVCCNENALFNAMCCDANS